MVVVLCIVVEACARDPIVQTPTVIKVLTKDISASRTLESDPGPLTGEARLLEPVVRVASRLIAATGRSTFGSRALGVCWIIAVYDARGLSRSFVRPDGAVVVYSGTFRLAQTEAGLAALLSHEFVHALVRDEVPVSPACVSTIGQEPALFSLQEELRTDEIALGLMADAGYDPREVFGLWERMREQDGNSDEVLLHFTYDRRIEQMIQWLPRALRRYERANRAPQKALPLE